MARVMIVEDDADVANLLAIKLRNFGHQVRTAPSARMAMNTVGIDFLVDVVLLDVNLPGMDGFELLGELRRHPELENPKLPAVFLSGDVSSHNATKSKAMGATFLVKPFVSGELQGALIQALRAQTPNPTSI